jgi:hypothetical protein
MSIVLSDRYFYTFVDSNGTTVRVLRGDAPPRMTDGGGGWSTVARPRRVGLTLWQGRNPYAMDVPILFDGFATGESVEDDIARLNQMQMGDDFNPPPSVTISGAVPIKGATWVMTVDWGDNVFWEQGGDGDPYRTRQDAVVHLTEFEPEKRLVVTGKSTLPNIYIVTRGGETMKTIARAIYGHTSKWTKIKEANPKVRDPNKLPIGTKLRIP